MTYDETIHIRVNKDDFDDFKKYCNKIGKAYYEVLREFMLAASDNRISIESVEINTDANYRRFKKELDSRLQKLEASDEWKDKNKPKQLESKK